MMYITNIHEAKTHFSKLVAQVCDGQEVIIGKAGKPVAKLVPYGDDEARVARAPGGWEGQVWMADDFDTLPADIAASFSVADFDDVKKDA